MGFMDAMLVHIHHMDQLHSKFILAK